jgi:hypothetical protein
MSAPAPPPPPPPSPWTVQQSRRTGVYYFFHTVTGRSVWYDEHLPPGWAWAKEGESAPRYYVNLHTGQGQTAIPTEPARAPPPPAAAAAASGAGEDGDGRGPKRMRVEGSGAAGPPPPAVAAPVPAATTSSSSSSTAAAAAAAASGPAPPAAPGQPVAGRRPPRFPSPAGVEAGCRFGWAASSSSASASTPAPALPPRAIDKGFFPPAHQLLLRQLVAAAWKSCSDARGFVRMRALAGGADAAAAEEEAGRVGFHCVDVGAGSGAATQAILDASPQAEVYAVDMWAEMGEGSREYYAGVLRLYGHDARASAWEGGPDPFSQFRANFAAHEERVVPAVYPAALGIAKLAYIDVVPWLVWLDADLTYPHVKGALDVLWRSGWADPASDIIAGRRRGVPIVIGGGGWDMSEAVRRAVLDFAAEHGLPLHVEQGSAWTFARGSVRETGNDPSNPLHMVLPAGNPAEVEALRVREVETQRTSARATWLAEVMRVIDAGDDVSALRTAVGTHGGGRRGRAAGTEAGAGAAAAAAASSSSSSASAAPLDVAAAVAAAAASAEASSLDPFSGEAWIDVGGDDKRHLNPLMRAAKAGRVKLVQALLEEHGADVNASAERSNYTALIVAAYDGREDVVRLLLSRGADPRMCNKFGETAAQSAAGARKGRVVAILEEHMAKQR